MIPGTLGIVGTGLIGGSIGIAARARGWRVIGYDLHEPASREALDAGAIDEAVHRAQLYDRSDVVVIAAHVQGTLAELTRLALERPSRPKLMIDVASVKAPVARAGSVIDRFVPTHPMAGTERSGAANARGDLFEGRSWAVIETGDQTATGNAHAFVTSLGAHAVAVDAQEHDRIVALTSHLPQLLASAFAGRVHERRLNDAAAVDALCGPTAKELLRLGRSPFAMWRDIFASNGDAIARELRGLSAALTAAAERIDAGHSDELAEMFMRAPGARA